MLGEIADPIDPNPLKYNMPVAETEISFEEISDVERFVDEVLQDDLVVKLAKEDVVVLSESSSCPSNEYMSGEDGEDDKMLTGEAAGISSDEDEDMSSDEDECMVDPFELLQAMGVRAFIEEQRTFETDPHELYEAFGFDAPLVPESEEALWKHLEEMLEEVYIELLCSSSSGDDMVSLSGEDVEMEGPEGEPALTEEQQSRLARANAFLLELRQKGPLQFAHDHEVAGTCAATFLADISFRLPRSMSSLEHKDQWSFIKRFLIKYVYQRPRLDHLNSFEDAVECIRRARKILIVTGAGISVSCGIPDFRSEHGLYAAIRDRFALPEPECMFDIEYFRDDPAPFFMLAKELFPGRFQPSPSHHFIRALEQGGQLLRNYTQNIDTLEQVAGIERAVYCHGSFASATCIQCRARYTVDELRALMEADARQNIPYCEDCEDGVVKPDIVFFGEPLPSAFDEALEADIEHADLVLVIGSSMKVQPVSMIPDLICPSVPQILINRERLDHHFDIELLGDADTILGEIARRLALPLNGVDSSDPDMDSPVTERVPPNITLFAGSVLGSRPPIPEPVLDGSLLTEALSPVQPDPVVTDLVHAIFPKPE